jgi:hypothetical protein
MTIERPSGLGNSAGMGTCSFDTAYLYVTKSFAILYQFFVLKVSVVVKFSHLPFQL